MAQSKATKRFEKRNLKDTLDRRNGFKKTKQKQQLKAKKKARRAEENGQPEQAEKRDGGKEKSAKDAFQDMSVDDFFQGGFEVPELPQTKKRKRSEPREDVEEDEASDVSFEQEPVPQLGSESASDEEDLEGHEQQLDALAENDPEFHKYLQENEPGLLGAELGDVEELSEDDDEPRRKKVKKGKVSTAEADESDEEAMDDGSKNELTKAMLDKWHTALTTEHSLRATKEVVTAFRAAAHVSDDDDQQDFKYSISDPDVYHQLLTLALKRIPEIFHHHLPVQESNNGKLHVPTESKKFKILAPLLKSQVASILHLLSHLSDASTLRLTLSSTLPLLPYLLSYKKLVRNLAKAITTHWSSPANTETTRIAAFLVLRRLTVIADAGIRENVLKATYQGLVRGSRNTTIHSLAGVNLMKNSGAELWGLADAGGVAYTTAFTFIRQLAIHLRGSIQNNANEAYKNVYNWQYVHSLDFWSRVLSSHATSPTSPLRPLIYPLVQVTLGALRLIPTATYFPLRFQLIRSLLRLSKATGTYIPLAAALYEVLNSAEMRKAPKTSTLKPLDWQTSIRAPKAYLKTRVYQDGVGEQVVELLGEFLGGWCKNVAFPELSLAVIVSLKRWLKDVNNRTPGKGNKNQKVNTLVALLVQKVEANSRFVEEKRAKVEFAPNNRKGVESFLEDLGWEKTPLGAFVVGQRRAREERERVLEEGRKVEGSRRGGEGRAGNDWVQNGDESMDEDEEMGHGDGSDDE
ncbi:Nucleolar Complex 2 protein [Vermiconidia calcicola]|uniref:Nucleolar Complex 2 protein n=1 Tax=Vermiconidia calcicola TaxID=1690605 RepID=A0ACC3NX51_9PEZI|nr:Nucleolar Complex 2 protein [Vermiconidia calcicola]